MTNAEHYGPEGLIDAFYRFCTAQPCDRCPVGAIRADRFRLRASREEYRPCIADFSDLEHTNKHNESTRKT